MKLSLVNFLECLEGSISFRFVYVYDRVYYFYYGINILAYFVLSNWFKPDFCFHTLIESCQIGLNLVFSQYLD